MPLVPIHQARPDESHLTIGDDLCDVLTGNSDVEVIDARVADEYLTWDLIIMVRLSDGRDFGLTVSEPR